VDVDGIFDRCPHISSNSEKSLVAFIIATITIKLSWLRIEVYHPVRIGPACWYGDDEIVSSVLCLFDGGVRFDITKDGAINQQSICRTLS
jgi:hypothetical protein